MTSTIVPALKELCDLDYDRIKVIDVGAARGSFMDELCPIWEERGKSINDIISIGIDPCHDEAISRYSRFIRACVDNIDSPVEKDFYVHDDTQANSLCIDVSEDGSVSGSIKKVWVLNLNTIIDYHWWLFVPFDLRNREDYDPREEMIHFLKIDAEGKDLDIVESLSEKNLKRIKYISLECKNGEPRYEGDRDTDECIEYMKSIGFDVSFRWDADNKSQLSDVVFMNREEL